MARGVFWLTIASVVTMIAGFAASITISHILGQSSFGELAFIRTTFLMLSVLAGSGFGIIATKYVAEFRHSDSERTGQLIGFLVSTSVIIGGGVLLLCLIFANSLAKYVKAEHLAVALQIGCLLPILRALGTLYQCVLAGLESFRLGAYLLILEAVLTLLLSVLGAWLYGVRGAVAGLVLALGLTLLARHIVVLRQCRQEGIVISYRNKGRHFSILWKSVLPAVLLGVVLHPFDWLAKLILLRQVNGSLESGALAAAFILGQLVLFLPRQLLSSSLPVFRSLLNTDNVASLRRLLVVFVLITSGAAIFVSLPLILFSNKILTIFGDSYASAGNVLIIVCLASIVNSGSLAFINTLFAFGKVWFLAILHAVLGISIVSVTMLLIRYGAYSVATGHLTGWILMFVVQLFIVRRLLKSVANGQTAAEATVG